MRKIITALILLICVAAAGAAQTQKVGKKDLKKLAAQMAGEFSSEAQSKADSSIFHIKLRMKPIWSERKDGFWFYVEQAAAETEDKPYRQRIYHLYRQDERTIVSKVYEMPNPEKYIGGWRDVDKLKTLTKEALIDRQGCAIYLSKNADGSFSGSTPGKECLSSLRGASYATSEVTIYKDRIITWDRGWDKNDKQVWGAVKGGYIFDKLKSF
jgi:CpeT protein